MFYFHTMHWTFSFHHIEVSYCFFPQMLSHKSFHWQDHIYVYDNFLQFCFLFGKTRSLKMQHNEFKICRNHGYYAKKNGASVGSSLDFRTELHLSHSPLRYVKLTWYTIKMSRNVMFPKMLICHLMRIDSSATDSWPVVSQHTDVLFINFPPLVSLWVMRL